MPIDASIPMQVRTLSDFIGQNQQNRARQQQMDIQSRQLEQQQQDQQRKRDAAGSLAALIGQRAQGGQWNTQSPEFQNYVQNDPEGALGILKTMDTDKRKAVEEGVKDLSAAVQWADSPEKWAVVQQHYGQFDPQLAATPFDQRERALISLGQMGDYLKATQPKIMSIEAGGSLAAVDPRTGQPAFTVLPNPGDAQPGAPATGGPRRVTDEASYNAVPPGAAYMAPDGTIRRKPGGPTGNQSGTFRPVGMAGERITSTKRTPERNRAVGGVPNSFHLSGRARDSVPPPGMSMTEYHRRLQAANPHLDVINEGDHIHMEPKG